jgi:hypothetical protein
MSEAAGNDPSDPRDARGRFLPGAKPGPGNPRAARVHAVRKVINDSVSDDDIRAIIARLKEAAGKGDLDAARELLDRTAGKASQHIEMQVEQLSPEDPNPLDLEKLSDHERELVFLLLARATTSADVAPGLTTALELEKIQGAIQELATEVAAGIVHHRGLSTVNAK